VASIIFNYFLFKAYVRLNGEQRGRRIIHSEIIERSEWDGVSAGMGAIHSMSYPPRAGRHRRGAIDNGTAEGWQAWRGLAGVATIGGGETRGGVDAGSGRSYGESGEGRGEMGRGGRWPDGEHGPMARQRTTSQSPSYGHLHTRLTYHLRG
jgi:hypothetical protein